MSHTSHEDLRARVFALREVAKRYQRPVAILVDLQGPKLRIGTFAVGAVGLLPGDRITLDDNPEPGDATRVYLPHPEILEALKPTDTVLIDDGKVRLHVVESSATHSLCEVEIAGTISNRKGVSLPDTEIMVSAMTPKDPRRSPGRARDRRRLDRALVRAATRGCRRGAEDRRRARPRHVEDREASGTDQARRDHRAFRRPDGGARRSRRRDATREGARPSEAHHPPRAAPGQTGCRGDADAGIDDHCAGADPRRGVRRGPGGVRGAPTPSCCRRRAPWASIRSRPSR